MTTAASDAPLVPSHVDKEVFRHVIGHFASGVTVITTRDSGQLFGTTASAVSSLSVEPPMMLVCLNRSSTTHGAIERSGVYAVNILSEAQGALARHFGRSGGDKFEDVPYRLSAEGIPLIEGALATLVCTVRETALGGTHTIFLGDAVAAEAQGGEPLAYYRGKFGRFEKEAERRAYELTREFVLSHREMPAPELDPDTIAAELGLRQAQPVHNALVALTVESLVSRRADGAFVPTAITPELVDNLYDARATIETGVVETFLETADDDELRRVLAAGEGLVSIPGIDEHNLDDFLALHSAFHRALVALSGSAQLVDTYRRLQIGTVWRVAFDEATWRTHLGNDVIPALADAVARRDVEAAKVAIAEFTSYFKAAVKTVIAERGGAI